MIKIMLLLCLVMSREFSEGGTACWHILTPTGILNAKADKKIHSIYFHQLMFDYYFLWTEKLSQSVKKFLC